MNVPSPSFSPLADRSGHRAASAYALVKEALLAGTYKTGERLSIETVASAIGSSRQPVMEAVRRLASEGLLTVIPQVGTLVPTVDAGQVKDFFGFLALLEGQFSDLAVARGSDAEIQLLFDEIQRYGTQSPVQGAEQRVAAEQYRLHNRRFHAIIHGMARSSLFDQTATALWDKADFYINTMTRGEPFVQRRDAAVEEHLCVARAIQERDAQAARVLVVRHILAFADTLQAEIAQSA